MKKLQRKWARVCFVLLVAAVVFVVIPWLMLAVLKVESKLYPIIFGILAAACILAEFLLSRKYLRCPHCGKSTVPPRWSNKTRYRCTRCATIFPFDDQPELVFVAEDEDEGEEDGGEYEDDEWEDGDEMSDEEEEE